MLNSERIMPILFAAVVAWLIYRRARRNFGRQKLSERRLQIRIALLLAIGALVGYASMRDATLIEALLGGIIGGSALGALGLRHTQFEVTDRGRFYTPHTYIGVLVTALFLARLVFRIMATSWDPHGAAPNSQSLDAYQRSPLTLATFGVLIGYYVTFNLGVLRKSRGMAPSTNSAP